MPLVESGINPTMSTAFQEFTRARLKALGIGQFEAARRGELERGFVRDILIGRKSTVLGHNLDKLAKALDTTPDEISRVMRKAGSAIEPPQRRARVRSPDPVVGVLDTGITNRDIPIRRTGAPAPIDASGRGGKLEGFVLEWSRIISYVARPPGVAGAADIYAVRIAGDSMLPCFAPGELRLVDPHRPVRERDLVLVAVRGAEPEPSQALIGVFRQRNARGVIIEQFTPQATRELARDAVAWMHRILTYSELITG
jgi:hypothetical protein